MINTYKYKKSNWISLVSPTKEEIDQIMDNYKIDPRITQDLLSPTPKPHVESHGKNMYTVLHFPAFKHTHQDQTKQEVDFVIGDDFVITVQYETIDPLHRFAKELEVDTILHKESLLNSKHSGSELFLVLVKTMYQSLFDEHNFIEVELKEIEENIFKGKEKAMVVALSQISRKLLDFKKTISYHEETLFSVEQTGMSIFGNDFSKVVRNMLGDYYKIYNSIEASLDSMNELRETNNALLSTKQNEVMKTLTLISFITLPLSLVATIFGINARHMPIVGHPNDFWIILSIMIIAMLIMFSYFRHNKWL